MSFLEWTFLFGAAAIAGPVLAHLLAKPRFRRLPFTMLQFLRSSQTESHSRRRLRDLLILLLRCAVIVLIALLFAQPILYIKSKPKDIKHIYYLGLDNSASMTYRDGLSSYFDRMKDSAIEHIVSAQADAVFNIFALASGDWIQGLSQQQALAEVKAMKITAGSADVDLFFSGLRNAGDSVNPDADLSVLLVSDFTPQILKQFLNVQEPALVDNLRHETVVSSGPINNASIINAQTADAASDSVTINVTVANHGQTIQKRRLTAKVGVDNTVSLDVELLSNQAKVYPVKIETGLSGGRESILAVELSLSPGDNLEADDTYYHTVHVPQTRHINVLLAEAGVDEMFLLETAMQTLSGKSSNRIIQVRRISIDDLNSVSLDWANICVCSSITERLGQMAKALSGFVEAGGKVVFFLTGEPAAGAMNQLWQTSVLPALPEKFKQEQTYPEISPSDKQFSTMDNIAAKAMSNYRIDRIPVTGLWQCRQHPDSKCLWQYQNESGFIYLRQIGSGTSILVNTSADDSLGSLTKSSVSVALCRFLLDIGIADTTSISNPGANPQITAGVNLPPDETDMSKPAEEEVDDAMKRIFSIGERATVATADSLSARRQNPIWKNIGWIIIALLLVEPALSNRLRR